MAQDLFKTYLQEARHIHNLAEEEPWKAEHTKAMKVVNLEFVFKQLKDFVDILFKKDNDIHYEANKSGNLQPLNQWIKTLEECLTLANKAITLIESEAKRLDAKSYKNAELTVANIASVKEQISLGLVSIKEWKEWKNPLATNK